ncbi:hypothetical protein ACK2M7_10175 [Chryseobacterium sp. TY4]
MDAQIPPDFLSIVNPSCFNHHSNLAHYFQMLTPVAASIISGICAPPTLDQVCRK